MEFFMIKKEEEKYLTNDWRSWGSWFSWGSPIGLSLGFAITIISVGFFLYLLSLSGLIGK